MGPRKASQLTWRTTRTFIARDQFYVFISLDLLTETVRLYEGIIFVVRRLRYEW
jgi:hypothetical protein